MRIAIICMAVILMSATTGHAFFGLFGSEESVKAQNGLVSIDASGLGNGEVKHYKFTEGQTFIRFFVLRDKQGVLRVAQDACEVCWREDKGYKLQDGVMLCVNCGMKFPLSRIGKVRGGCNPHPIAFSLDGDKVGLTTEDLLSGAKLHPGNKI